MTRRDFLAGSAISAAVMNAQRRRAPNFVIIYADDLGIGDLGCYGAKDTKTPNIDRLAASGARFTNWYSNCPVCSPSRASLMTGKYPQRTGITEVLQSSASFDIPGLRAGENSLARELKQRGYRTGYVGKWHLGSAAHSRPLAQGFDEFFGFYSGWTDYYSHRYYRQSVRQEIFHDLWRGTSEEFRDAEYQTEVLAKEAAAFLEKQKPNSPFFLSVGFGAVHYPMMAPQKYVERFPASMDRDRRMHAAVLAALDDAVGMLIATLDKRGLAGNTVVFFQSDNGATSEIRAHHKAEPYRGGSNAPFRGYKAQLFEGGIRMPAVMAAPGRISPGRVIDGVGATMDILPTFLDWTEGAVPVTDGKSVRRMVEGNEKSPHDAIFWEYLKQQAVREGDWKLLLNAPGVAPNDSVWLTNLADDPGETRNLASQEPQKVKHLRSRLDEWRQNVS